MNWIIRVFWTGNRKMLRNCQDSSCSSVISAPQPTSQTRTPDPNQAAPPPFRATVYGTPFLPRVAPRYLYSHHSFSIALKGGWPVSHFSDGETHFAEVTTDGTRQQCDPRSLSFQGWSFSSSPRCLRAQPSVPACDSRAPWIFSHLELKAPCLLIIHLYFLSLVYSLSEWMASFTSCKTIICSFAYPH